MIAEIHQKLSKEIDNNGKKLNNCANQQINNNKEQVKEGHNRDTIIKK